MKFLDHKKFNTMNLINYMASFSNNQKDTEFQGFMPIKGDYANWGVELDGHNFCALHLYNKPQQELWSDDPKEQTDVDKGLLWILVFYGVDNTSYIRRFKTRERALKWIKTREFFVITDKAYWFNS